MMPSAVREGPTCLRKQEGRLLRPRLLHWNQSNGLSVHVRDPTRTPTLSSDVPLDFRDHRAF